MSEKLVAFEMIAFSIADAPRRVRVAAASRNTASSVDVRSEYVANGVARSRAMLNSAASKATRASSSSAR